MICSYLYWYYSSGISLYTAQYLSIVQSSLLLVDLGNDDMIIINVCSRYSSVLFSVITVYNFFFFYYISLRLLHLLLGILFPSFQITLRYKQAI